MRHQIDFRGFSPLDLISPAACVIYATGMFLACLLMPGTLYEAIVGEKNYLFLDGVTMVLNCLCIFAFVIGVVAFNAFKTTINVDDARTSSADVLATLALIAVHFLGVAIFVYNGGLRQISMALSGDVVGEAINKVERGISVIFFVTPYFLGWLFSRCLSRRSPSSKWLFFALITTFLVAIVPLGRRSYFAQLGFSLLAVYALHCSRRRFSFRFIAMLVTSTVGMLILFLAYQHFRTGDRADNLRDVTRYVVTPYNLESMLVHERIVYPGSRTGYYFTTWIWRFPILGQALPMEKWRYELFGPPAPIGADQRGPIGQRHGIVGSTAMTVFGMAYVDFGWFAPLAFGCIGFVCGFAWRQFKSHTLTGVYLYPMIAYSVLQWGNSLIFPHPSFGYSICFLAAYSLVKCFTGKYEIQLKSVEFRLN